LPAISAISKLNVLVPRSRIAIRIANKWFAGRAQAQFKKSIRLKYRFFETKATLTD
jgi:hypothetical protein